MVEPQYVRLRDLLRAALPNLRPNQVEEVSVLGCRRRLPLGLDVLRQKCV
jgi:hypothetical protein